MTTFTPKGLSSWAGKMKVLDCELRSVIPPSIWRRDDADEWAHHIDVPCRTYVLWPISANRMAMAWPIPDEAPVTSAVLFVVGFILLLRCCRVIGIALRTTLIVGIRGGAREREAIMEPPDQVWVSNKWLRKRH
jgi:hypothetical protein